MINMTNPFRRAAWTRSYREGETRAQRLAYWAMMGHHVLVMASGLVGLGLDPSPSVARVIGGEVATVVWSLSFVLFGIMGIIARGRKAVPSEVWVMGGLIMTRLLFVAFIVAGLYVGRDHGPDTLGALQTAGVMLAGTLAMLAIAFWQYAWLKTGRVAPSDATRQTVELTEAVKSIIDGGGLRDRNE